MRVFLHAKSHVVADLPGFIREDSPVADADLTAEQSGRLCFLSGHRPNPKTATNGRYLLNICAQKHYSVLGHATASFYIETSRNCTHEIIRHRWFTFSEVSQRYVDADKLGFESHPGLPRNKIFEDMNGQTPVESIEHVNVLSRAVYRDIVTHLTEAASNRKQARQAARSVLPGGTQTMILMSGNLRAWRDFLAQRLSLAADLEIRQVALEIYKIVKAEFPNSFQDFDSYGMLTTERLIKRAQARRDMVLTRTANGEKAYYEGFSNEVDKILEQGLWVLVDDPWVDGCDI